MQNVRVKLFSSASEEVFDAIAEVETLSAKDAFFRGLKRAGKISGISVLILLPFAVIEPFLFLFWGSIAIGGIFLFLGPALHLHFYNERNIFKRIVGKCPNCKKEVSFQPYLSQKFTEEFVILCETCSETCTVRASA